ncbi:MAG: hypothetical protein K0R00_65 [Herbinix sp.]|jgi:protein-S-isoprenylcysteine O-methyltransferase Ste14|nr:hypothetical protein [Herbinix sp.]
MKMARSIIGALMIIAGVIIIFVLSAINPDMTEWRLFLTYWKEYLGVVVLFILGQYILLSDGRRKKK